MSRQNDSENGNLPALAEDMLAALQQNADALAAWEKLSPSHQREYLDWIDEAKKPETRERRIGKMVDMVTDGLNLR